MQVAFYLAGEVTQVLDAIPWVRCASGNVLKTSREEDVIETLQKKRLCHLLSYFAAQKAAAAIP